jgi:HK97 family phage major capsid protein
MRNHKFKFGAAILVAAMAMFVGVATASVDVAVAAIAFDAMASNSEWGLASLAFAGVGNTVIDETEIKKIITKMSGIETAMSDWQAQAKKEIEETGKVAKATEEGIDNLGIQQKAIADRLLALEQNGSIVPEGEVVISLGKQFTDSDVYSNYMDGQTQKARFEVKNSTTTGGDATVAPDRKAGVVPGASQMLTLESMLTALPTASNAIEYTREASFVNNADAVAEAGAKPETTITFELKSMPMSTIAHWTKISKQLAEDAPALAAYINFRMTYGVDQATETQIGTGDGVGANLSGLLVAANYTAHGIAAAALGSTLPQHVLVRKVIALLHNTGYKPDAILLNPIDFGELEIDALTTTSNAARITIDSAGQPWIWGVPIVQSSAITQDSFLVGSFGQAATLHNRQSTVVELSDSDGDNFQKNLITVRAERRVALTVEVPGAIMGGDLTPA